MRTTDSQGGAPPSTLEFRGERLRLARLFRGMTLEELGTRVAATRQYMHQLETTTGKAPTGEMPDAPAAVLVHRFHETDLLRGDSI